jgi:hypothetical protein
MKVLHMHVMNPIQKLRFIQAVCQRTRSWSADPWLLIVAMVLLLLTALLCWGDASSLSSP